MALVLDGIVRNRAWAALAVQALAYCKCAAAVAAYGQVLEALLVGVEVAVASNPSFVDVLNLEAENELVACGSYLLAL